MRSVLRAGGLLVTLATWELLVRVTGAGLMPSPSAILEAAVANAALLAEAAMATAIRVLLGLAAGFVAATLLATAINPFRSLRNVADGPIELLRPIPPIALTPFFIILLGLGAIAQVSLVGLGAFMVFYVGWSESFKRVPLVIVRSAESLGYKGWRLTYRVLLPAAWPAQKPIWRVAVASGMALSVAAEYLGAQGGLGYVIRNARTVLDLSLIGAASGILGLVAIGIDGAATSIIGITSGWTRRSEADV